MYLLKNGLTVKSVLGITAEVSLHVRDLVPASVGYAVTAVRDNAASPHAVAHRNRAVAHPGASLQRVGVTLGQNQLHIG